MPATKQRYIITCFKGGNHKVGKVTLYAYREVGSWDYFSNRKINFLEGNTSSIIKRVIKDPSTCDYVLIRSDNGKQEVLIPTGPLGVETPNLYPKLAKLRNISILKRQEAPDIEENVVFSKTLVNEEFPAKRNLFVFEGEVKLPENAVGLKITTDSGERILLMNELLKPTTIRGKPRGSGKKKETKKKGTARSSLKK